MRRLKLSFLLLAIALFSCQKEVPLNDSLPGNQSRQPIVLKAYLSNSTKASISDDFGTVVWNSDDTLSVFDSPAVNGGNKFVTADGGEKAEFSGEAGTPSDGQFYALYPYSQSASYSDGSISAYLPQEQVAVAGSFDPAAFLMVGRSATTEIGFYDVLGGIRFTVENSGYDAVEFSGNNNETVAGPLTISFADDGYPVADVSTSSSKSISLRGEFEPGNYYYFSIVPQVFKNGFTLKFMQNGEVVKTAVCPSYVTVQRYIFATVRNADREGSLSNIIDGFALDSDGTSNCYIVREQGSYKFPLVKGNSNVSVGTVASAKVLWETDNTSTAVATGALIKPQITVKNGKIYFKTADTFKPGNALIGAYDASGKLLWSWHIWLCDFDPQQTKQVYVNTSTYMMDRNIGALSTSPSGTLSYGLFYQWGRKDPFPGSTDLTGTPMATTGTFETLKCNSDCTVDFAVEHPATFILCDDSSGNDWISAGRDNTLWTAEKTIYDPCPAGWRVPDGGTEGVWKLAGENSYSMDFYYKGVKFNLKNGGTAWYPATGFIHRGEGDIRLSGQFADYWTVKTATQNVTTFEFYIKNNADDSYVGLMYNNKTRGEGHAVRCQKL